MIQRLILLKTCNNMIQRLILLKTCNNMIQRLILLKTCNNMIQRLPIKTVWSKKPGADENQLLAPAALCGLADGLNG